jgi:hypothetical protein
VSLLLVQVLLVLVELIVHTCIHVIIIFLWKNSAAITDSMDDCLIWSLAPELLFAVVSNLDGRDLSTVFEALLSSKRHQHLLFSSCSYVMHRWQEETMNLLSIHATNPQPALVSFMRETMRPKSLAMSTASISSSDSRFNNGALLRQFSEWCLLLDYVLLGTRSTLFSSRMVWPVGVGVFAVSPFCGGNRPLQTKVTVHCPLWDPTALIRCHDIWFPADRQTGISSTCISRGGPSHFAWLPSEGDIDGFVPEENIGILTPFNENNERTFRATQALTRDDDFLPAMGRPDSCLTILPALDCPIYGSLMNSMVRASCRHSWVLEETATNDGGKRMPTMLCFYDRNPKYPEASEIGNVQEYLVDRIVHLMKTFRR